MHELDATLIQKEKPVAYSRKALIDTEQWYAQTETEIIVDMVISL